MEIHATKRGKIEISFLKTIDAEQAWFWTNEHQRAEKSAQQEIHAGKGKHAKNAKDLISHLTQK